MPIGVKASKARAEIAAREAAKAAKAAKTAAPTPAFARQARISTPFKRPKQKKVPKRSGSITATEKTLVAQFMADQKSEITPRQETALATVLGRTPATTKRLIQEARESFTGRVKRYVDIHSEATEKALALADSDPRYVDSAIKSSQWALTNISGEGQRVVDKPTNEPSGTRVYVGIKLGGVEMEKLPTIDVTDEQQ